MKIIGCSITDWIQLIFMLFAGIWAIYLLNKSNREKRNKLLLDILDRFMGDKDIKLILYSVDCGHDIEEIRFGGTLEQPADKTIKYIDYLGHLLKKNDLKESDISVFRYEIKRILNSPAVQEYISWLKRIGVSLENLDRFEYLL